MKVNIADIRIDYSKKELDIRDCNEDPTSQFKVWMREALEAECIEPTAMTVSSCSKEGQPSSRIVLLKDAKDGKFIFFSNYSSRKAKHFDKTPLASINFFWRELERQVNIEGQIVKLDEQDSIDYYNSRPYNSRIGAWASEQSATISSREELEERFKKYSEQYPNEVPKPKDWGGYAIIPTRIEFWQGRPSRLHDRILYIKNGENNWAKERLAP